MDRHLSLSRFLTLGSDHLWLLGVLACFVFVIAPMPVSPNDFWWHLKAGELIYQSGSVPTTNIWGWSLPADFPYTYGAWLAEYLFYVIYLFGGIKLLIFIRNLAYVLAFAVVGIDARLRSNSWRIAGVVVTFGAAMSSNNVGLRPQVWSWLVFPVFYLVLSAYVERRIKAVWLLVCPILMAFWVNIHGSFVLGAVLLAIFFVGEVIGKLLKVEGTMSWREIGWIGIAGGLTAAGMLINPQNIGIIGYVFNMMTDQPSQSLVVEWQSPAPNTYATILFFLSILFLLVVFVSTRYRPRITELLVMAAFLWLAWSGVRYIVWYAMAVMPILAKAMKGIGYAPAFLRRRTRSIVNSLFVAALFVPGIIVQPWFIESLPMTPDYWSVVLRDNDVSPLLSTDTPIKAVEYLRANPGGQMYNEMGYGSYMIWAIPDQKVFIDTRVELYPYDQWLDYIKINNGVRYNELLQKYGANRLILSVKLQPELILQLESDPLWSCEYRDEYSQIWIRTVPGF